MKWRIAIIVVAMGIATLGVLRFIGDEYFFESSDSKEAKTMIATALSSAFGPPSLSSNGQASNSEAAQVDASAPSFNSDAQAKIEDRNLPLPEPLTTFEESHCPITAAEKLDWKFEYNDADRKAQADYATGPVLEKKECYAVKRVLDSAENFFELGSKWAVVYGVDRTSRASRIGGNVIKAILSAHICTGNRPFDATSMKFEIVATSRAGDATIYLGERWVSDGTVMSAIPASEYAMLYEMLSEHQLHKRQGISREKFDRHATEGFRNWYIHPLAPESSLHPCHREREVAPVTQEG
jgi:hypothetical protein